MKTTIALILTSVAIFSGIFAAAPANLAVSKTVSISDPTTSRVALQSAHDRAPASESSAAAAKRIHAPKSAFIEFSANRTRVGGREIAGFSARQAGAEQEQNVTPPAGLKPVEQEA
jgi:hypothetical protein